MARYECKECGATANSKCAFQRTVFPRDQFDALLSNILKYEVGSARDGIGGVARWVTLKVHTVTPDDLDRSAVAEALTMVASLSSEQIAAYSCNHVWTIAAGETCDFGCCKG